MNSNLINHDLWDAVLGLLGALHDAYLDTTGASSGAGRIGEATIPALLDSLHSADERERTATAWILWTVRKLVLTVGEANAVPDLVQALRDEDTGIRRAAARALGWLGEEDAVPDLLNALEDDNPSVRRDTAGALGKISDVRAIPGLIKVLQDKQETVRYAAAWALGQIGNTDAVPGLIEALHDEDRDARRVAARALGWIADAEAVPGLIEALADESSGVRRDSAGALGKIGDARAVPDLLRTLRDKRDTVRYASAWALGQIGSTDAVPGLVESLRDENRDVRRATAEALGEIGDARAVPILLDVLREARRVGDQADIYAFGVVLYDMLTASLPVEAREFGPVTSRIIDPVTDVARPIHEIAGGRLRPAGGEIGSAEEVVRRIEEIIGDEPPPEGLRPSAPTIHSEGTPPRAQPVQLKPMFKLVTVSGQSIPLAAPQMVIGRSNVQDDDQPDIDLRSYDVKEARTVSRRHCRITQDEGGTFIEDMGSRNGTRLNDQVLEPGRTYALDDGDKLFVGRVMLIVQRVEDD